MKSIGIRFLLPFGLLALAFSAFALHRAHAMSRQHARTLISRQAALALEFNLAIREYAAEHIRPTIEKHAGKDAFARETMSTSFISRSIFEKVREKYPDCIIRFSSDDPRNPINKANSDELRMIEYFRKNPHTGERAEEIRIDGRRYLAHFVPKWVKEECLRCHGDPQDAPAEMIEQYGAEHSFHRVLGDVAGLDTVAIPLDTIDKAIASETRNQALVLLVGLALMTGSVAALFRATVTRRLTGMARHFSEIAANFDSTRLRPVAVSGADEIGVLGRAFNSLVERLSLAHTLLESRVEARTADLARANDELKREISERLRAEQALRASEERYRRITQATTDYIYHVRMEDGRTVETIHGPACEAVTGYTAEEFAADPLLWIRMVHEEERGAVLEHVDRALNGGSPGSLEHRIHRKDGDIRWVQNTIVPQHDHDGRLLSYDGLIRDVTERRLAEQALRDSEGKFRAIAEHARVGIVIVQDSKFVYVNPYAALLTGNAREELFGRRLDAVIHPESLAIADQRLAGLLAGTPAAHAELRLQTRDGTERWVEADSVPFMYSNRPAIITAAVDMTSHRSIQEELRRERDFNRTLVQSSPAFFVAIGADGKTIMINESMLHALGYRDQEIAGKDYLGTFVPEHERESVSRVFEQIICSRQGTLNENHILTRDGRELLVEWHGRPVFRGTDLEYFFGVGIDITDRRRAEQERDRLFNHSMDLLCIAGFGGRFKQVNPAWTATLGWSENVLLSRPWLDFVHPSDKEKTIETGKLLERGNAVRGFENRYICKDGTYRWLSWNSFPLPDEQTIFCVVRDVTEQKHTIEALRHSEEKLRSIFRAAPIGVGMVVDRIIKEANERLCDMVGYTREELLDKSSRMLYPTQEDYDYVGSEEYRQIRETGTGSVETRWQRKDGSIFNVLLSSTPLDPTDLSSGVTFAALDITERKHAAEELDRAHALLTTAIEQSPAGILIADAPDVTIRLINPAALGIRGKTDTPLTEIAVAEHSKNWHTYYSDGVTPYPPEQLPLSRAVLKGEVSTDNEAVIVNDDGDKRWISANAGPVRDKAGRIIAGIVVFHDITDRKRAEENRLRLEAELRHAQKMEAIGTLATGIAHDFNNLLTAISGYTELARSAMTSDHPARQFLDVVDTAVRDASGIAKSLLTFSRKTIVAKAPIDLRRVVTDSLKLLRRILPASITVTENLPADHPVYTYADIGQLHQVLMNLITNARDAMPSGGTLRISLLEENKTVASTIGSADEATEAVLVIEDTGVGMSPDVVSRIFDPFFTTKPRGKGTGLGMAMVHGIVEEHNGEVRVESQPGQGTRISVRLPCCDPPIPSPDTENTDTTAAIGQGKTVLLAEDEEFVRRIMIETLKGAGFEVVDFTSGAQAMASFNDTPDRFALVVLDIDLPEMSGLHCMKEIRKTSPNIPILLVTGEPEVDVDEDQDERLVVLHKPFKMAQMMSLARILLAEPED